MQSIWNHETELSKREALKGRIETDTAVIGGGLAGVLIAFFVQQQGIPAVVLEANRIGSGQTRNTTAKITCQHGLIYDKLIRQFGIERARQYALANQTAIETYRRIVQEQHIDCDLETLPAYLYSNADPDALRREAEAANRLGIAADFTMDTALPFPVKGALRFDNQAQFHPLKFLRHIADHVTIYERTSVQTISGNTIRTKHGTVHAKHIVFASHFPFVNFPGLYFARMHQERSYVVALRQAQQLDGVYLGMDANGISFRNAGNLLLLGGGSHRTGLNTDGGQYATLRRHAQKWYPNSTEIAYWSAQDCMPIDGIPFIGQYARSKPNWFVATGFQKWGMTSSMVSAQLIGDLIGGKHSEYAAVFCPQRFHLRASAKNLSANIGQFTKGVLTSTFAIPRSTPTTLPVGCGKIVSVNGKRVGAYKDSSGTVHLVSARCPHLGCALAWNPEERSWDCPCHGSRFDYTGRLISGPAQTNITLSDKIQTKPQ